jgi:hypothetical protein
VRPIIASDDLSRRALDEFLWQLLANVAALQAEGAADSSLKTAREDVLRRYVVKAHQLGVRI